MIFMQHKHCGGIIAQAVDPNFHAVDGMLIQCKDFYLTGTLKHPEKGSKIMCPKCKKQVAIREIHFTDDDDDHEACLTGP